MDCGGPDAALAAVARPRRVPWRPPSAATIPPSPGPSPVNSPVENLFFSVENLSEGGYNLLWLRALGPVIAKCLWPALPGP